MPNGGNQGLFGGEGVEDAVLVHSTSSFELSAWVHDLSVKVFTEEASVMHWLADAPATDAS